jgi:hypothetical protein
MSEQMSLFIGLINAALTVVTLADGQSYSKITINNDLSKLMLSLVIMMRTHEQSASGQGVVRNARSLNLDRGPTWTRSKSWHSSFAHRVLTSRSVLGEYQTRTWNAGRSAPVGEPIPGYYPAVIGEKLWAKAQERRKKSTPGRRGGAVINLFTGIIYDGQSGSPMRLTQWNHTPTAAGSTDRGSSLVSDYARLGRGEKVVSWRYGWFERWFLDYMLSLSKRPEK